MMRSMRASPTWQFFVRYLRPLRAQVLLLAVLLGGGIGLQLANPQVLRYFLDSATGGSGQAALLAAVVYLLFALAHHGLGLAGALTGQQVAWRATNQLRRDLTLHCLRLDMSFHKQRTPGELIERIDGDATALANFFSEFAIRIAANSLLVVGILALLFVESAWVGVLLAGYTLLTVLLLGLVQRPAVARWTAARQLSAELNGFVEERISGVEDIQAAGAAPYTLYRLQQYLRAALRKYRAAYVYGALALNTSNALSAAGYALGLAVAMVLFTSGQATIGAAYLVVAYVGMLAMPLQAIRQQARDWQESAASLGRIQALLALENRVPDPPAATATAGPGRGPLSVEFDDVTFRYEDGDDVLHGVSFHLQPGRVLGILGRTGSGKTTLARLLFRLYDPSAGQVRLGGHALPTLAAADLRASVGMVTQDVQLFRASLRDNLALFNPGVSDARITAALRELRLWDWAESRPGGLDHVMGAGGAGLSAGEAQLLAFARAFLKDPGVVVLDEASSRLDPATEALLENAISRLLSGRTALIIAHRLRTVEHADDVLILEDGRVVEFGARRQLAADPNSRLSHLLRAGLEAALE